MTAATLCPKCSALVTPAQDGPDLMCPRCKLVLPAAKRIGRPPKAEADRVVTPVRTLRLSDEHWAELQARGGTPALREWLSKKPRRCAETARQDAIGDAPAPT